jgi:hypothetical protein
LVFIFVATLHEASKRPWLNISFLVSYSDAVVSLQVRSLCKVLCTKPSLVLEQALPIILVI